MSILGIRNELRDLDQKVTYAPDRAADVLGMAGFVEDAIKDWEHKYPADPWLPKSVYQLTRLYSRVHTGEGQQHAALTLHWLVTRYHRSRYASQALAELGTAYNKSR